MDGLEGAVDVVVARLKAALPAKTAALRARYDVDPETEGHLLPDVITVAPYDAIHLGLEDWPAVLVSGLEATQMRRAEVRAGVSVWTVQYALRAYVWARGEDEGTVARVRNRLTLAVRELLLSRQTMTSTLMVDSNSLSESYSELAQDEDGGTVGAAYVAFSVWAEETLAAERSNLGTVVDRRVDTGVVPPHPAAY